MENCFKKYAAGVYCIQTQTPGLKHGDIVNVETRHGKTVECMVWKHLLTKNGFSYYSHVRTDGLNRTEWMRRKQERMENAAERQRRLSDEYYAKATKDRDFLVLGEPIKVGHHSEKRHRKAIENADKYMGKTCEAASKAEEYDNRAESLGEIADNNINSDSPDSLDALRDKLAAQEAKRDKIKAHNKANKENKYPAYVLSNLGANIRETKRRLQLAEKLWCLDGE